MWLILKILIIFGALNVSYVLAVGSEMFKCPDTSNLACVIIPNPPPSLAQRVGKLETDVDSISKTLADVTKTLASGNRGLPAGTIITSAYQSCPKGSIPADGKRILDGKSRYPELYSKMPNYNNRLCFSNNCHFDVYGTNLIRGWGVYKNRGITGSPRGVPISAINEFIALPDLRGEFVRGWDKNRNVDQVDYSFFRGATVGSRNFGTTQADGFKSHNHHVISTVSTGDNQAVRHGGKPYLRVGGDSGGLNSDNTGGNETRPRNIALLYCIVTGREVKS